MDSNNLQGGEEVGVTMSNYKMSLPKPRVY